METTAHLRRGKPWFRTVDRVVALLDALEARRGLPFRDDYRCWHFLAEVIEATGYDVAPLRNAPEVSLNWGRLHRDSKLLAWLKTDPHARVLLRPVDLELPIQPGDIVAVRESVSENHVGIASSGDTFWQLPRGGVVTPDSIGALRMRGWLAAAWRLYEPRKETA